MGTFSLVLNRPYYFMFYKYFFMVYNIRGMFINLNQEVVIIERRNVSEY